MSMANNWIAATKSQLANAELGRDEEDAIVGLYELSSDKPRTALAAILEIVELHPGDQILGCLGAGPLEELLVKHSELLEEVIGMVRAHSGLRICLQHVNLDDDDSDVSQLLRRFLADG